MLGAPLFFFPAEHSRNQVGYLEPHGGGPTSREAAAQLSSPISKPPSFTNRPLGTSTLRCSAAALAPVTAPAPANADKRDAVRLRRRSPHMQTPVRRARTRPAWAATSQNIASAGGGAPAAPSARRRTPPSSTGPPAGGEAAAAGRLQRHRRCDFACSCARAPVGRLTHARGRRHSRDVLCPPFPAEDEGRRTDMYTGREGVSSSYELGWKAPS